MLTNRRVIKLLERLELAAYAAADVVVVVSDGFRANLIDRGVPAGQGSHRPQRRDPGPLHPATERQTRGCGPASAPPRTTAWSCTRARTASPRACPRSPRRPRRLAGQPRPLRLRRRRRRQAPAAAAGRRAGPGQRHLAARRPVTSRCRPCWPRPTSAWSRSATSRSSRRSSRPRCSSTWPQARPVIGAVTGEAAQILREAGAVVVPPGDSPALAAAIRALAADPAAPRGMARQAGLRRAVLRPRRAGPAVPEDPRRRAGWGGTGEAAGHRGQRLPGRVRAARGGRRGHECARWPAARPRPRRSRALGAQPAGRRPGRPGPAAAAALAQAAPLRRPAQPGLARLRPRPGHRRGRRAGAGPPGRVRLHHRGHHHAAGRDQARPAGRRAADPRLRAWTGRSCGPP